MGTSTSYKGLKGTPGWKELSTTVTSSCGSSKDNAAQRVFCKHASFVRENRRGNHGGGSGVGHAGAKAAKKLQFTFSTIRQTGLSQSLASWGMLLNEHSQPKDVINFLLEHVCGSASSLDEVAAKQAEKMLLEEICLDAESIQELQDKFQETLQQYSDIQLLVRYFTYYLFTHLSQRFYESLVRKKGKDNAGRLFQDIKDYIKECVIDISAQHDLQRVNWNSTEGGDIEERIFNETLNAFADYEN